MSGTRSPRSKHGSSSTYSGDFDSLRERLLTAFADCVAAEGFESTTVSQIAAAAGVSEAAFHEEFRDKEECFCAAMEKMLYEIMDRIAGAQRLEEPWPVRLRTGVTAVLRFLEGHPSFARMVMIEAPSSGRRPPKLYASARRISQSLLDRGLEGSPVAQVVPPTTSASALAGAESLIVGQILAGKADRLSEIAPDVVYLITVHYRSQEEALRQFETATAGVDR